MRSFAPSMDRSFVFFLQIFAFSGSDWSRRAATQQTSSKFLVPRKSMKAHGAILSMLVVLAAAESATEDRFLRRHPTRLTVSRTQSARSSRRSWSKAMELSTRGKADTESGRVLPKSPVSKKFRESLHLHMSTSVEIFVRPATDQCASRKCYSAFRQKFPKLWTSVAHSFLQQMGAIHQKFARKKVRGGHRKARETLSAQCMQWNECCPFLRPKVFSLFRLQG